MTGVTDPFWRRKPRRGAARRAGSGKEGEPSADRAPEADVVRLARAVERERLDLDDDLVVRQEVGDLGQRRTAPGVGAAPGDLHPGRARAEVGDRTALRG